MGGPTRREEATSCGEGFGPCWRLLAVQLGWTCWRAECGRGGLFHVPLLNGKGQKVADLGRVLFWDGWVAYLVVSKRQAASQTRGVFDGRMQPILLRAYTRDACTIVDGCVCFNGVGMDRL